MFGKIFNVKRNLLFSTDFRKIKSFHNFQMVRLNFRMKRLLFLLMFFCGVFVFSQKNVTMYYEKTQDTLTYYIDNSEVFPCSIVFSEQPVLENMRSPESFRMQQLIPAKSKKVKVSYFVVNDKKKSWGVKKMPGYRVYAGNVFLRTYDSNYEYELPYRTGKSFIMNQGYNGKFSHKNENALDFTMPEGTEILAARGGLVIEVIQKNSRGCPSPSCKDFGNFIRILHSDGSMADYAHLKYNGSKVKVGQQVEKGEFIALSGNTGYSEGPHLHFVAFIPALNDQLRTTIKTLFKVGDGKNTEYLSENKNYLKNY